MSRVRLIHWKAEEARRRCAELRSLGHRVIWEPTDSVSLRAMKASPPDVFVIGLSKMHWRGRDIGVDLRRPQRRRA
jgi:hypothetical protein